MSATKAVTIWCDGTGGERPCLMWTSGAGNHRTIVKAREYIARHEGWSRTAGKDLCPDCNGHAR